MNITFTRPLRLLIFVHLAIIILFAYLAFTFYRNDKVNELTERSDELNSIAKLKQSLIVQWHNERLADARYLSSNEILIKFINSYSSTSQYSDSVSIVKTLRQMYRNHDYSDFFVLAPDRKMIIDLNPSRLNVIFSDSLDAAVKTKKLNFSGIYFDSLNNSPSLDIYIPLFYKNKFISTIILKIDPGRVLYQLLTSGYSNNTSRESYIKENKDGIARFISPLKYDSKKIFHRDKSVLHSLIKSPQIVQDMDYRGIDVVEDIRPVEGTPWYLVTKIDLAEVYSPVNVHILSNIIILGLITFLGGLLFLYVYTRTNYNNLKKLSEAENKFTSIFENSSNAMLLLDNETIIDCNRKAEELFDLSGKNIIDKHPVDLSPEYQSLNLTSVDEYQKIIASFQDGNSRYFQWIFQRNGSPVFTELNLSTIELNNKQYILIQLFDITSQKLIEESLLESERKFIAAFQLNPQAMIITALSDGKIAEVNDIFISDSGFRREELIGHTIEELQLFNDDVDRIKFRNEIIKTENIYGMEVNFRIKSGHVLKCLLSSTVFIHHGKSHLLSTILNITDRKIAEEALLCSEKKYKYLFDNNPQPMWIYDTELLSFLEVNNAALVNYGYSRDEFLSMNLKDIIPSEDFELLKKNKNGSMRKLDFNGISGHRKKNGEIIFVETTSHLIDFENHIARLVLINDVTEREQARQQKEIALSQLTNLYNNLPEAIFSIDTVQNKMLFASPAHESVFGYTPEAFFRNPDLWYQIILPEDKPVVDAGYPILAEGKMHDNQFRITKPDGSINWIETRTKPTLGNDGKIIRIDGIASNITDRKEIELTLLNTRQKLGEVLEHSVNLFYAHDPDFILTYVSPQSIQFLDCTPEEAKVNWTNFITDNPVNLKGIELTKLALDTGQRQPPYELELKKMNGELIWVEVNEAPVVKDGITISMVGSLTDVTARKKAEDNLKESQLLLTNAIEVAHMGHWQYDVISDTFKFNDQFYKMFRTSVEEVGSYTMSSSEYANKFVHPDDIQLVGKEIQGALATTDPYYHKEMEHRILYADGEIGTIVVRFNILKDENGKTIRTFGVNQDISQRKVAEEKLIESQTRFRKLIENAPDGITLVTKDGKFKYISPSAFKIFGYKSEDIIDSTRPHKLTHPDDLSAVFKAFRKIIADPLHTVSLEYRFKHRDGSWRWIESTFTNLLNEPSVQAVVINYRDINEQKFAREELKISESKYHDLFDNVNDAIMIFEPETEIVLEVNNKACEIYNIPKEKFLGLSLKTLTKDIKDGVTKINNTLRYKSYRNFESRQFMPDGRTLDLLINASVINFNGKTAILSINRDISERKIAEENIKLLSRSIEQSQVSVVITDPQGIIQYVNNKFTELTGYSFNEVNGSSINILHSDYHPPDYYQSIWNTILSGKDWHGELLIPKKNGECYWENAVFSPIINEGGKITNIVGVKEDITEKKKMIEELISAKEKAEEANILKSHFLANMSHELRTPLVGILGFAELLSDETTDADHLEMTETILRSGRRLLETLNSILDISRIEANKQDINPEIINIGDILTESIQLFKPSAKEKGLSLNLIIPGQMPVFLSDRDMLIKIFNNLINNAVKYTEQGSVTIKVSTDIDIPQKSISIEVSDTGIGINKKHQEIIFEPFRQVSEGLSRTFEGTGLGLSITQKLVKILNGTISLKSNPGIGSTFTIKFPIEERKIMPPIIDDKTKVLIDSKQNLNNSMASILLVEDDKINASVVKAYLNNYTFVDHVIDGSEAVNICKEKYFDAILMDINLKGMNGVEAAHNIRLINEHFLSVPIIAMTAYAMKGDKERFLSDGFDYYISKPFRRSELLDVLSNVIKMDNYIVQD